MKSNRPPRKVSLNRNYCSERSAGLADFAGRANYSAGHLCGLDLLPRAEESLELPVDLSIDFALDRRACGVTHELGAGLL